MLNTIIYISHLSHLFLSQNALSTKAIRLFSKANDLFSKGRGQGQLYFYIFITLISLTAGGTPQSPDMSSTKIVCKQQNTQLILNCSKLQLNLFRILKLLNEVNLLPLLFPERNPPDKPEKNHSNNETETVKQSEKHAEIKKSHEHELSVAEALNLVWYSASICKSGAMVPYQINKMIKNRLVGQENQLNEIIDTMQIKIRDLVKAKTEESSQAKQARAKLARMRQIQRIITTKWNQLKEAKMPQLPLKPNNINIGHFSQEMSPQHRQILITFARKSLLKWDIKLVQESIMFIQQVQTGHCIVSLQQCYPTFMVYKELLKCLIGQHYYNNGVKQLLLCKEQNFKEGRPFVPSKYVMCHLCRKIQLLEQVEKRQDEKICEFKREPPTIYASSYAFDQIIMRSNYHRLPLRPLPETDIKQCYEQTKEYQKYVHPYIKVYYPKCSRYYCSLCLQKMQYSREQDKVKNSNHSNNNQADECKKEHLQTETSQKAKDQVTQNLKLNPCVFCTGKCPCDRCVTVQNFKKLLAFYKAVGGSFEDISPELMFLNFYCTRIHIQLVTFQKEYERDEQNSEENRVQLEKVDEDTLSYPQQVSKLQGWFCKLRDKQRVKLYGQQSVYNYGNEEESVDQNQIFPELQDMFDKLLREQNERDQEFQVKILQQQQAKSVMSAKSAKSKRGRKKSISSSDSLYGDTE